MKKPSANSLQEKVSEVLLRDIENTIFTVVNKVMSGTAIHRHATARFDRKSRTDKVTLTNGNRTFTVTIESHGRDWISTRH